jgi:hypothetical protein
MIAGRRLRTPPRPGEVPRDRAPLKYTIEPGSKLFHHPAASALVELSDANGPLHRID